jgi:hypothetical protein
MEHRSNGHPSVHQRVIEVKNKITFQGRQSSINEEERYNEQLILPDLPINNGIA